MDIVATDAAQNPVTAVLPRETVAVPQHIATIVPMGRVGTENGATASVETAGSAVLSTDIAEKTVNKQKNLLNSPKPVFHTKELSPMTASKTGWSTRGGNGTMESLFHNDNGKILFRPDRLSKNGTD